MRAWPLAIALCCALFGCSADDDLDADVGIGVEARSAHAFDWIDASGTERAVLLTGVRGPNAETSPGLAQTARAELDALISNTPLILREAGAPDRYERQPVQALDAEGSDIAVALVRSGWAMVWPRVGQDADFAALFEAEASARADGVGAWTGNGFAVLDPDPDRLAQHLDGPVIVEGRVVATGEARDGRAFINFGLNWRTDFTISLSRDARERFEADGLDVLTLEGAVIRVRGWLVAENGPMVRGEHRAQIELVDAPRPQTRPR